MALLTLRYNRSEELVETRGGITVFNGSPGLFHEWEFRTLMRWQAAKDDGDRATAASKIVEGLRGDAFNIAIDLGRAKLITATGITDLVEKIREFVFPSARAEIGRAHV